MSIKRELDRLARYHFSEIFRDNRKRDMSTQVIHTNGPFYVVERPLTDGSLVYDVCNQAEAIARPCSRLEAVDQCDTFANVDKAYKTLFGGK